MPIPDTEQFAAALRSLSLSRPPADRPAVSAVAVPGHYGKDERGATIAFSEITLWYSATGSISLDALVGRLAKELVARGHSSDKHVILTLLSLYSLHPRRHTQPTNTLNALLDSACEADLSQFYVLFAKAPLPDCTLELDSFKIGVLDIERLRYLSRRAGSDYHERYESRLQGRMTVERAPQRVTVLPLNTFPKDWPASHLEIVGPQVVYELVNGYFNLLGTSYFDDFWNAFLIEQHHLIAYGAPYIASEQLRVLPWSDMISIFSRIGGQARGWVVPNSQVGLELAGANERIPAVQRELRDLYGFQKFRDSELHRMLRTYVLFVSRAKRHYLEARTDEAFLHFVIALDLSFGDPTGTTDIVAKRTAALVHRPMNRLYHEQKARLRELYNLRSRYVHSGKTVSSEVTDEVETICDQVLRCLLRLQSPSDNHELGFVDAWLKRVDHIATALEAGLPLDDAFLEQNGVLV